MKFDNKMLLSQNQTITAKQIQSLELLCLNNTDLDAVMQNEYLENPMLENRNTSTGPNNKKEINEWYQNTPIESEDLFAYFWEQLDQSRYANEEINIIRILIGCLDDNGFLDIPVEELVALTKSSEYLINDCLEDLKKLEPIGVFSRNLSECLIRQLEASGVEDEVLYLIIREYLDELSQGKIASITRKQKLSSGAVRTYMARIAALNPRPLSGIGKGTCNYVIPDIIVEKSEQGYEVTINDKWLNDYQINDYYVKMLNETTDPELKEYFRGKKQRVVFLMEAVEQRRRTLVSIIETIIELQGGVLEEMIKLKPVTMKSVAERMQVSISTVSRAVKDKHVQYPKGTVLMKDFFSVSVNEAAGGDKNAVQIQQMIKALVDHEEKTKPYSDAEIVGLLKENGVAISRRGVANYRDKLGIKGSYDRRIIE